MSSLFAQDLRLARRKSGYTQGDLAHLIGSHQASVSAMERGKRRPSLEVIIDLSLIYGRSFESLFDEIMKERRKILRKRLRDIPKDVPQTAATFNRSASLTRLRQSLSGRK